MLCIIGSGLDPEIDRVRRELKILNCQFVSIDRKSPAPLLLEIDGESKSFCTSVDGQIFRDISTTWLYNKSDHSMFGSTAEWAMDYIVGSSWDSVELNISLFLESRVVNPVLAAARLSSKLLQLKIALRNGFEIPSSVLTNDVSRLKRESTASTPRIVKMLGNPHIPVVGDNVGQRAVLTNEMRPEIFSGLTTATYHNPIFVQTRIEKRRELRIIVVGTECFAFEIDSTKHPLMETDYRRAGFAVDFLPVDIGNDLKDSLLHLHNEFDLDFGCYDFIEQKDGSIIFLEVNPMGVWSHHDDIVGGAVSRAIARYLHSSVGVRKARQ